MAKPTPTPAIRPDAGGHRFGPNLHCGECGRSWTDHQCEPAPCEHAKEMVKAVAKAVAEKVAADAGNEVAAVKLAKVAAEDASETEDDGVAANEPIVELAPNSDAERKPAATRIAKPTAGSPAKTVLKPVRPASWLAAESKDSQD